LVGTHLVRGTDLHSRGAYPCFALVGITTLAALGIVTAEVVIAVYSMTLGGAVGYINGKKSGRPESPE
jgi:hypothetical protein